MKVTTTRNTFVVGLGHVPTGTTIEVADRVAADLYLADAARPDGAADKGKACRIIDATVERMYPPPAPHRGGYLNRWRT